MGFVISRCLKYNYVLLLLYKVKGNKNGNERAEVIDDKFRFFGQLDDRATAKWYISTRSGPRNRLHAVKYVPSDTQQLFFVCPVCIASTCAIFGPLLHVPAEP